MTAPVSTSLLTRATIALAALVLAAGCAMGPDYVRPETPSPTAWRTEPESSAALTNAGWWDIYRDPTLAGLIDTALRNNTDLRLAVARIDEAAAVYQGQHAELFPGIGGSASYSRGRSGLTGTTGNDISLLGVLSYEVDLWGRLRRLDEAARAQLLAADYTHKAVMTGLVANVAISYFNLRALDEQLALARSTLDSRLKSYELTEIRFNGGQGIVSELDVRQAETQVAGARSTIAQLARSVALTENSLNLLLGRNPGPIERPAQLIALEEPPVVPAGLPSDLLLRRPDILATEQQLIAANANIGAARAARFPKLSLTAALGVQSSELDSLFDTADSTAWNFNPALTAPIFDWGKSASATDIARARQQAALANYEQAVRNAFREVDDALVSIARLREQVAAEAAGVAAERKRLELAQLRYEGGVDDYSDVLDAERFLFSAELGLVATRAELVSAIAQLYKALGGGWTAREGAAGGS